MTRELSFVTVALLMLGCSDGQVIWSTPSTPQVFSLRLKLPSEAFHNQRQSATVMVLPACASCTAMTVDSSQITKHSASVDYILIMGPRQELPTEYGNLEKVAKHKLLFSDELQGTSPLLDRYVLCILTVNKEGNIVNQRLIP